jgi:putative DNA primase/helicase
MNNLYACVMDALAARSLAPVDPRRIRLDGSVSRYCCEGDRKPNAWAIVHTGPRPILICGHWARQEQHVIPLGDARTRLSPDDERAARAAMDAARRERGRELAANHDAARMTASRLWAQAAEPLEHSYLTKKRIAGIGLRQLDQTLLVPLRDEQGELWNVQRIRFDGEKRFLRGGRVRGLSCELGEPTDEVIVCEGWATGAALHLSAQKYTLCAMTAANL